MFIIYGRKTAHISNGTSHDYSCENCKDIDMDVNVFREYLHMFFIPFFPIGQKNANVRCNNCGDRKYIVPLQQQYEKSAKTPVYLYSGLIVIAVLILLFSIAVISNG